MINWNFTHLNLGWPLNAAASGKNKEHKALPFGSVSVGGWVKPAQPRLEIKKELGNEIKSNFNKDRKAWKEMCSYRG